MEIKKLGHNGTYAVKTAENCHTFFDEVRHDEKMGIISLRAHGYVSGAIYDEKAVEFLKLWEIEQCK